MIDSELVLLLVLASLAVGTVTGAALERWAIARERRAVLLREATRTRDSTAAHVQLVYPHERDPS